MATFIDDERPEDVNDEQVSNLEELGQEAPQEPTPESEDTIPEKYQGKSTAEIVRMHQEAEKLLGKQSGEVGELRSVVDSYINIFIIVFITFSYLPSRHQCLPSLLMLLVLPCLL